MKERLNKIIEVVNNLLKENVYHLEEDEDNYFVTTFSDTSHIVSNQIQEIIINIVPFLKGILKLGGWESNIDFSESEYLNTYSISKTETLVQTKRSWIFYFDIIKITIGVLGISILFINLSNELINELGTLWLGFLLIVGLIIWILSSSVIRLRHIFLVNRIMLKLL